MTAEASILICSNLIEKSDLLAKHFRSQAYKVHRLQFESFEISAYTKDKPDLIILTSKAEEHELFISLIKGIRSIDLLTPILHIIEEGSYSHRVESLRSGCDDALSNPFALEELDARLETCLRQRDRINKNKRLSVVEYADFQLNTQTREVTRLGITEKLTVKEYELLSYFLQHPGETLERKLILSKIWGIKWEGQHNLLEVYIRYLRKKIERSNQPKLIITVRGMGYMLR